MGILSTLVTARPVLLIVWLVFLTINVGLLMNLTITVWMIYAVVLLFTGGIIILFTYIVTLVFSLKVTFSNPFVVIIVVWASLLVILLRYPYFFSQGVTLSNLYLLSRISVLALIGGYLLLVLLAVVKLAVGLRGPLKSFFKNEI